MGLFDRLRRKKALDRGHVHIEVDANSGEVFDVRTVSPLAPEEIAPAVDQGVRALVIATAVGRADRLEATIREATKAAGMIDRLRGRVSAREEAARQAVPHGRFRGEAGGGQVWVELDGRLGVHAVHCESTSSEAGFALVAEALKAAEQLALAAWTDAISAPPDSSSEGDPVDADAALALPAAGETEGASDDPVDAG